MESQRDTQPETDQTDAAQAGTDDFSDTGAFQRFQDAANVAEPRSRVFRVVTLLLGLAVFVALVAWLLVG